jgi:iron complex transport system permease protein
LEVRPRTSNRRNALGLLGLVVVLGGVVILSVLVGARDMSLADVFKGIFVMDDSAEHLVVWESRLPRTLVGLVVGPALGVCGALIQAFTRNPLADPGILGVNAGAAFAVTLAIGLLGITSASGYVWFALLGAFIVTFLVYALGTTGRSGATPEKLTLAGVAVSAVLGGVGTAITLKNREAFDAVRFWGVGSIGGRSLEILGAIAPIIVVGLILALSVTRSLNAIALGDELGRSLGARIGRTRAVTIVAVTVLAGGATAIAGPIAFVGLMVPHAVRWFTGPDQRWIIPFSMVGAAILLLAADVLGRVILPSGELRVGIMTAVLGAPILILLARRRTAHGL